MVVVPTDYDDGDTGSATLLKERVQGPFRLRRRHIGVERVAADQYRVDGLAFRDT